MELGLNLTADASAGAWMTLRDPRTGEDLQDEHGKPARLKLAGKDSTQWRKAADDTARRQLEESARNRKWRMTPEALRAASLRQYAAVTLDWENCAFNGTSTFSVETARDFYASEPWALDQVEEFIGDRANFSKGSKTP